MIQGKNLIKLSRTQPKCSLLVKYHTKITNCDTSETLDNIFTILLYYLSLQYLFFSFSNVQEIWNNLVNTYLIF